MLLFEGISHELQGNISGQRYDLDIVFLAFLFMYPHKSAKAAMVYVPATLFCLLELGLSSPERVGVFVVPEGNSNPLLFSGDGQLVVTIIVAATITIIVVAIIIRPSCLPDLPTQQFRSTPNPKILKPLNPVVVSGHGGLREAWGCMV